MMASDNFRALCSVPTREYGDESVHFPVETQVGRYFATHGFKRATQVMDRELCCRGNQFIGKE